METGFLNPIHDEEHFQSTFYSQESGLNDSDAMLFSELIVPEVMDFENLWYSVDNTGPHFQSGDQASRKEDFKKMYFECQQQLNYMQEPEAIKQIVSVAEKTTQQVSEMFANHSETTSTPSAPSIDELFPLECNKDPLEEAEERSEENLDETVLNIQVKKEVPLNVNESHFEDSSNIKEEREELNVDVETVEPETPLLLAGDLTSLLEQFEATEKVNLSNASLLSLSPPRPTNQTIRDALPAEVIQRIKANREIHKKIISVIPAMPSKRPGRAATRMQDAGATLSRNKLLKLVTGGSNGESVQLDHDYCTSGDTGSTSSKSFYVSDSSEYPSQSSTPDTTYSRLPEFYVSQVTRKKSKADTGSRKDSGLESGDNSDEEVHSVKESKNKVLVKSVSNLKNVNVATENGIVIESASVMQKDIPMISVLKKNNLKSEGKAENSNVIAESTSTATSTQVDLSTTQEISKKKKLNLEEYRVRREERERFRSQESSRANSPSCCTPPSQPDSTTVSQEGVPKDKPVMLSVEVQTQTCDFIDLTSSKSSKDHDKSHIDRRDKRNKLKHRSYRSRHASTSSSSSTVDSDHHHSHRRKKRSSNKHRRNSVSRMWSRSPSRSPSRSNSASSSRSRSRSHGRRQKWRSRSPRRNHRYSNNGFHRRDKPWHSSRVRSPIRSSHTQEFGNQEKVRQVEERRVIYVGRIDEGTTKADLRRRFQSFGPIVDISVHFRERGDNYGFVTFAYKADAYKAVEHGNDDPKQPRYDLCFGGRRAFCKQRYADLDGIATAVHSQYGGPTPQQRSNESFDLLLHEVKAQLRKRSSD